MEVVAGKTSVNRGFFAAFTDGFDFFNGVGDLKKATRARPRFLVAVAANTVSDDGDIAVNGDLLELIDLLFGEKLSLVDEKTVDGREVESDEFIEVVAGRDEGVDLASETNASVDFGFVAGVDFGLKNSDGEAERFVVVGNDKKLGGFTAAHGAVTEIEFAHGSYDNLW